MRRPWDWRGCWEGAAHLLPGQPRRWRHTQNPLPTPLPESQAQIPRPLSPNWWEGGPGRAAQLLCRSLAGRDQGLGGAWGWSPARVCGRCPWAGSQGGGAASHPQACARSAPRWRHRLTPAPADVSMSRPPAPAPEFLAPPAPSVLRPRAGRKVSAGRVVPRVDGHIVRVTAVRPGQGSPRPWLPHLGEASGRLVHGPEPQHWPRGISSASVGGPCRLLTPGSFPSRGTPCRKFCHDVLLGRAPWSSASRRPSPCGPALPSGATGPPSDTSAPAAHPSQPGHQPHPPQTS